MRRHNMHHTGNRLCHNKNKQHASSISSIIRLMQEACTAPTYTIYRGELHHYIMDCESIVQRRNMHHASRISAMMHTVQQEL